MSKVIKNSINSSQMRLLGETPYIHKRVTVAVPSPTSATVSIFSLALSAMGAVVLR